MDLISNMGEYQTKDSPVTIIWEHYKTTWFVQRGKEELFTGGWWAVAESQRGMTQDKVKIVCQGATPWKTGIFLRGRVEPFTGGLVTCCWVPKRNDAGWGGNCMPSCNALKNGHLPERKVWDLYRTGEWPAAESQRGMTQRMGRMTAWKTKKLEKESINILFDAS